MPGTDGRVHLAALGGTIQPGRGLERQVGSSFLLVCWADHELARSIPRHRWFRPGTDIDGKDDPVIRNELDRDASNMLEKALRILQAFRPQDDCLRLATLVERTGMPKSTVHRLVTELLEHGLIEHEDGRGYRPGIVLFELSSLVPVSRHLREKALPYLQDLYVATHQTVHLAIREGTDSIYIEKIHGHSDLGLPSRVGGRLPLVCTGVGRALLAFSALEVQHTALARPTRRLIDGAILDQTRLSLELADVRRTGLSYERGEIATGHGCIASPVLVDGVAVAAISLSVPIHHYNLPALAGAVKKSATSLAAKVSPSAALALEQAG